MNTDPVVRREAGRVLVDRASLARLSGRSVHTIRARCPVAEHQHGRALYDAEQCRVILAAIPTRKRSNQVAHDREDVLISGLSG